jgi:hypothetical protein
MSERPIATLQAMIATTTNSAELETLRDELARAEARAAGSLDIYAPDPRLVAYRVLLETGDEYRFYAEDADHAREQAGDAEPDYEITGVVLGRKDALL